MKFITLPQSITYNYIHIITQHIAYLCRYEITEVTPDILMTEAMNKQAAAERGTYVH